MGPQSATKIEGNGYATRMLLGCVLAVMGFLAVQIWNMSDRLARVETHMEMLLQKAGAP